MRDCVTEQIKRIRDAVASTLTPGSIEHILVTEGKELTITIENNNISIDAVVSGARGTWDLKLQPPGDE